MGLFDFLGGSNKKPLNAGVKPVSSQKPVLKSPEMQGRAAADTRFSNITYPLPVTPEAGQALPNVSPAGVAPLDIQNPTLSPLPEKLQDHKESFYQVKDKPLPENLTAETAKATEIKPAVTPFDSKDIFGNPVNSSELNTKVESAPVAQSTATEAIPAAVAVSEPEVETPEISLPAQTEDIFQFNKPVASSVTESTSNSSLASVLSNYEVGGDTTTPNESQNSDSVLPPANLVELSNESESADLLSSLTTEPTALTAVQSLPTQQLQPEVIPDANPGDDIQVGIQNSAVSLEAKPVMPPVSELPSINTEITPSEPVVIEPVVKDTLNSGEPENLPAAVESINLPSSQEVIIEQPVENSKPSEYVINEAEPETIATVNPFEKAMEINLMSVGFCGLNSSVNEEIYIILKDVLTELNSENVNVVFDTNKGYAERLINEVDSSTTGILYEGAFLSPLSSEYSDISESRKRLKNIYYFSTVADKIEYFLKNCEIVIFPENEGLVNFVQLAVLLNSFYLYSVKGKKLVLVGSNWEGKLNSLKENFKIDDSALKNFEIVKSSERLLEIIRTFSPSLGVGGVNIIDLRDEDKETL